MQNNGLVKHCKYVYDKGFDIVFYSLKGSQNYRLSTEKSDIDSYIVVMPTLKDLALSRKPISENFCINGKNGKEYIIVQDVRTFFAELKNYNFYSLEVLFSDYLVSTYKYWYVGESLKSLDWASNNFITLRRTQKRFDELCSSLDKLNFESKTDRKTFNKFIVDYSFLLNISEGFYSFEIFNDEWRKNLLDIKNGKMSKEKALEVFPVFEMRDFIKKEEFTQKFYLSEKIKMDLSDILYRLFMTKFQEV